MRLRACAVVLALLCAAGATAAERRCGWFDNPTPANMTLRDRDAEWTLSEQGSYHAEGFLDLPDMTVRGWVAVNGSYGYGCACLTVEVDRPSRRILRLVAAQPVPIARCQADPALPSR